MLTFDDVLVFMLASNIKSGRVWANCQYLKDFFNGLKSEGLRGLSGQVRDCIESLDVSSDIEDTTMQILVRYNHSSESTDNYLHMNELVQNHAIAEIWRSASTPEDRTSLKEITRRYGEYLNQLGH